MDFLDVTSLIADFYRVIFGVLLFAAELSHYEISIAAWVLSYFTFLQTAGGRGMLCAYLGTSNLSPTQPLNFMVGIALCAHAILSLGVCCADCKPGDGGTPGVSGPGTNDAAVDRNALLPPGATSAAGGAAYEWASQNPEQAQKVAGAGLNFAAENPEVMRSAFQ